MWVNVRGFLSVGVIAGYVYCDVTARMELRSWFKSKLTVKGNLDFKGKPFFSKTWWIPNSVFCVQFAAGGKFGIGGEMSGEAYRLFSYMAYINAQYNNDWKNEEKQSMATTMSKVLKNDFSYKLSGKATLTAGPYAELSVTTPGAYIYDKIGKVSLNAETGMKAEIGAELVSNNTALNFISTDDEATTAYDVLNRDASVTLGPYIAANAEAEMGKWKVSVPLFDQNLGMDFEGGLVPRFSDVAVNYNTNLGADIASAALSRQTLMANDIGFAVYDSQNKRVGSNMWFTSSYYDETPMRYSMKLSGLEQGQKYRLFPITKVFGYELLASPCVEFTAQAESKAVTVAPDRLDFDYQGGSAKFTASTNVRYQDIESVTSTSLRQKDNDKWYLCTMGSISDPTNMVFTVEAQLNSTGSARSDSIIVCVKTLDGEELRDTVTVSQDREVVVLPTLEVSRRTVTLEAKSPEPAEVEILTDVENLTFSKSASWLSYTYDKENNLLFITAEDNVSENTRSAVITVEAENSYGSTTENITVEQDSEIKKYTGLFLNVSIPENYTKDSVLISSTYSSTVPRLYVNRVPVYCTSTVTETGANLHAFGSETASQEMGTNTIGEDDNGKPVEVLLTANTYSQWNISLVIHRNDPDDDFDDTVSGTITNTMTREGIHTYVSDGTVWQSSTSTESVSFTISNVPFYDFNMPVNDGYWCEGFKMESNPDIVSVDIRSYIQDYVHTYTLNDEESVEYSLSDDESRRWSIAVGVWDPVRGTLKPYGEP